MEHKNAVVSLVTLILKKRIKQSAKTGCFVFVPNDIIHENKEILMKKTTWIVVVLAAAILAVGGYLGYTQYFGITVSGDVVPDAGPVTIRGDVVCLTKKPAAGSSGGNHISTLECAIGLKDKGSHQYGLLHLNSGTQVGGKITVSGTFIPGKVDAAPDSQVYDTVGEIDVSSVR